MKIAGKLMGFVSLCGLNYTIPFTANYPISRGGFYRQKHFLLLYVLHNYSSLSICAAWKLVSKIYMF